MAGLADDYDILGAVRKKYPEYAAMDDKTLASGLMQKYQEYGPYLRKYLYETKAPATATSAANSVTQQEPISQFSDLPITTAVKQFPSDVAEAAKAKNAQIAQNLNMVVNSPGEVGRAIMQSDPGAFFEATGRGALGTINTALNVFGAPMIPGEIGGEAASKFFVRAAGGTPEQVETAGGLGRLAGGTLVGIGMVAKMPPEVVETQAGYVVSKNEAPAPAAKAARDTVLKERGVDPTQPEAVAPVMAEAKGVEPPTVETATDPISSSEVTPEGYAIRTEAKPGSMKIADNLDHETSHQAQDLGGAPPPPEGPGANTAIARSTAIALRESKPTTVTGKIADFVNNRLASLPGLKDELRPTDRIRTIFGAQARIRQLARFYPDLADKYRTVAGSQELGQETVASGLLSVRKAAGNTNDGLLKTIEYLQRSRLVGLRDAWDTVASEVKKMPMEDFKDAYEKSYAKLMQNFSGLGPFRGRNLSAEVEELLADGKIATAQGTVQKAMAEASSFIKSQHLDPAEELYGSLESATNNPLVQAGVKEYQARLAEPLTDIHLQNEGFLSEHLGPANTWIPLAHKMGKGEQIPGSSMVMYAQTENPWDFMATGLANAYDLSPATLTKVLKSGIRKNAIGSFVRAAQEKGLLSFEPQDFMINGREMGPTRLDLGQGIYTLQDGRRTWLPSRHVYMPAWLRKEIAPGLEYKQGTHLEELNRAAHAVNSVNTMLGIDAIFHGRVVASTTGKIIESAETQTDAMGKTLAALGAPVSSVRGILAARPIMAELMENGPGISAEIQELANIGMIPPRVMMLTRNPEYAAISGAKLVSGKTPSGFAFSREGLDMASRIGASRAYKRTVPTELQNNADLAAWVGKLGNYNAQLSSDMARVLKKSGIGAFVTAGQQMTMNAVASTFGKTAAGGGFSLQNALMSGVVGTNLLWAVAYRKYTGKFPWQDTGRMRYLQIPLNPEDRQQTWAQSVWGPGKDTVYLSPFGLLDPLAGRGMRAMGLQGALNTVARGGDRGQAEEAGMKDMLNTLLHPVAGPAVAASTRLFGFEPNIVSMRDEYGHFMPVFRSATKAVPPSGILPGMVEHGISAVAGLNPATMFMGDPEGKTLGTSISNYLLPGAIGGREKPGAARKALEHERALIKSQHRKHSGVLPEVGGALNQMFGPPTDNAEQP